MPGCCGLITLCIGAVCALSAIALMVISVNTDYWLVARVDRDKVIKEGAGNEEGAIYFTRTRGLFRECYPDNERPPEDNPDMFLSIVEDWCILREYHFTYLWSGHLRVPNLTEQAQLQLHLSRTTPCLLFLYLTMMCLVGCLGLSGCWSQSANKLISTAAIQLVASLVGATAMATWHAALFLEMEKVHMEGFPLMWPPWLLDATQVTTGWSYLTAWAGVCSTLVASLATSASAIALRAERKTWEEDRLRMRLKFHSMFAEHSYYPGDISQRSTPLPPYPDQYRSCKRPDRAGKDPLDISGDRRNVFMDYKRVMGELENSKF